MCTLIFFFFFFSDTSITDIYTLSLHDALPICFVDRVVQIDECLIQPFGNVCGMNRIRRSEEHTSELQSRVDLVCRLLLEKKKQHHYRMRHLDVLTYQRSIGRLSAVPT